MLHVLNCQPSCGFSQLMIYLYVATFQVEAGNDSRHCGPSFAFSCLFGHVLCWWFCLLFPAAVSSIFAGCPRGVSHRAGSPEGKCWASALCRSRASPSRPIPQTSVLRPLGGPVAPALTGVEVLELGPQWCAALHSPWGPARPALPQKASGWHNWQSSTWVALGAS